MSTEQDALLQRNLASDGELTPQAQAALTQRRARVQAVVGTVLTLIFLVGVPLMLFLGEDGLGTGLQKTR